MIVEKEAARIIESPGLTHAVFLAQPIECVDQTDSQTNQLTRLVEYSTESQSETDVFQNTEH